MAGAGYKLFNTGDVLTAAQVNTYLQEQTVMVFASSTARTTALSGVLAEGMMSYLQDTNAVEVYNGTSWVNVGNAGDITEVQAGVGISIASGTGPIPVITNSSTDLITTAGDLLYGTAADTMARLGIGTAGQVLKVNSGATAPEWGAVAAGGMTLLASGSHSGTTLTLSSISTSYINLFLILDGIDVSTTSYLLLRFNNDTNANRHRAWDANVDGGTFTQTNGIISAEMNASGSTNSVLISVPNYANTNSWKFATSDSFTVNQANTANWNWRNSKVGYNQTTAITQLDIFESASGSFSCSYKLYGVK
jgi:hypothetical protein